MQVVEIQEDKKSKQGISKIIPPKEQKSTANPSRHHTKAPEQTRPGLLFEVPSYSTSSMPTKKLS